MAGAAQSHGELGLTAGPRALTHRELDRQASRLANYLLLDKVGESLALFNTMGRELYRNQVMQRELAQHPDRALLMAALSDVVRAVGQTLRRQSQQALEGGRPPSSWRRVVQTSNAQYRLRGCVVSPSSTGSETAILVSMVRMAPRIVTPDAVRARFGLTDREAQVASLLAERLTNAEIAEALGISSHTARHHTESVLLKLGVNSRKALRKVLGGLTDTGSMERRRA